MVRAPAQAPVLAAVIALATAISVVLPACATDTIENRRVGQQLVCHRDKKTLAVSNADSFVHLDHGDSPGPCPDPDND